jgi:hypothetical protein
MDTFLGGSATVWTALQALFSFAGVVALVGLFVQVVVTHHTTKHQVYGGLNNDYMAYLERCAANPDLQVHDIIGDQLDWYAEHYCKNDRTLAIRELCHFALLFSLWEHSYLDRRRKWMDDSQWIGWHVWMVEYLRRPRVLSAWHVEARTYDEEFLQYVADKMVIPIRAKNAISASDLPPRPWPTGCNGEPKGNRNGKAHVVPPAAIPDLTLEQSGCLPPVTTAPGAKGTQA